MSTNARDLYEGEEPLEAMIDMGILEGAAELAAMPGIMARLTPTEDGYDCVPVPVREYVSAQWEKASDSPSNVKTFVAGESQPCACCTKVIKAGDRFVGTRNREAIHLACVVCPVCSRWLRGGDVILSTEEGVKVCAHGIPPFELVEDADETASSDGGDRS